MEENTAQPRLSYGVRGNIFSFLLDWDQTQEDMSKLLGEGNVLGWPVEPSRAAQIVRVRLTHGQGSIIDKFKELRVRAQIVRQVAYLYIEHNIWDLDQLPEARDLHA